MVPGGSGACSVVVEAVVEAARRWILAAGFARRLSLSSAVSRSCVRVGANLSMAARVLCCFPPLRESRLVMHALVGPSVWFCRNLRIRAGPTLFSSLCT